MLTKKTQAKKIDENKVIEKKSFEKKKEKESILIVDEKKDKI